MEESKKSEIIRSFNGQCWYESVPVIIEPSAIMIMSDIDTPEGISEMIRESKERIETEMKFKLTVGEHFIKKYSGER